MVGSIESKWRNLEELLSAALDQGRALMGEIDQFLETKSRSVIVGQHCQIRELRLADNVLRAWLVQEHIMHDTAPPDHYPMLAAEAHVAN